MGLRRLFDSHSGENQAEIVWSIVVDFQIQNTVGFFTLDNASNNFTAVRSILNRVNIVKTHSIEMSGGNLTALGPDSRFVHCYGHVLNLVVKGFLYGKKALSLATTAEKKTIEKENQEIECWRNIGPLGKLRNLTLWIQGSVQQRESFCQTVGRMLGKTTEARELILGNITQ